MLLANLNPGHVICGKVCFEQMVNEAGDLKCGNCRRVCRAVDCNRVLLPAHSPHVAPPLTDRLEDDARELINYVAAEKLDTAKNVIDFYERKVSHSIIRL